MHKDDGMLNTPEKPVCAIVKDRSAKRAVFSALSHIDIPDLNGMNVLLKPNIGRNVAKNTGINTNPAVTHAVYQFLRERFRASFYIGDSPILGVKTREAFASSGHGFLTKRKGLQFVDLDGKKPTALLLKNGRILKEIKVTGYLRDMDYIVSIPVLKMHMHTGASLSFKNMKGLLYGREKVKLHQLQADEKITRGYRDLDVAIADLAQILKPDLAVIDATYAQEGMGPSAGNRKRLDTVIASADYLAADIVALDVVKQSIKQVPHLAMIADQQAGVHSIDDIATIPADISAFRSDFAPPPQDIKIDNHMINLIDVGSCSACLSSIFLFAANNKPLIQQFFNEYGQLHLAVGKNLDTIPRDAILIGKCAQRRNHKGRYIKGCPPTQTLLKQAIERLISKTKKR
jgi:uncharacterized protein (DUF362 family)